MHKLLRLIKRFGVDAAGYSLIILGLLIGWLPGPGGIPLILAGLGLLAIHNHWARRILKYIKDNGLKFLDYVFPEKPIVKALHDFLTVGLIIAVIFLITRTVSPAIIGLSISLTAIAIVDFLYNRKRWQRFKNKIKKA